MKLKRIIALGAALVLTATAFPSCGGKKEETKITNVFKETDLKLSGEYSGSNFNINQTFAAGDVIYAQCYLYDEKTYESREFLLPINLDGTTGAEISMGGENSSDGSSGSYLQTMSFADDGTFWASYNLYKSSETEWKSWTELRHYSDPASGKYEVVDLGFSEDDDGNSSISNMVASPDGSLVLSGWGNDGSFVLIVSPDGKVSKLDTSGKDVNQVQRLGDKLYASMYVYDEATGSGSSKFVELDVAAGKLGTEHSIPSSMMYNLITGKGYDYYYNDGNSIWAGNLDSEEKVEILNFINSDINGNTLGNIIPISADKFFATAYDDVNYNQYCMILDRVPDEQVAQRELISLSTPRLDYSLRSAVIKFNKSNDKYRIVVNDYSIYATDDDYNAGASRLTTDLTAGKIPDIIQITDALPYDSLVSKKLFTDIYALMDADTTFDRSLYLENIFKACETDGKLYSLIPRFQLMTFAAKTENLEGLTRWTVQEFMNFVKNHEGMQIFDYDFNRATFLQYVLEYTRDNFIDRKTGECRFNSDEFKQLLQFAKDYLTTDEFWANIDYNEVGEEFWQEYDKRFVENKVLLTQVYFYNLINSYKSLVNYTLQSDATLIGFPSDDGSGAGIQPSFELGVTNKSKHKEGAWEFLKYFLSEDQQMPTKTDWGYNYGDGLPVMKAAIEKQLEIAMTPPENGNGDVIIGGGGITVMPALANAPEETTAVETTEETETQSGGIIVGPIDGGFGVGGVVTGETTAADDTTDDVIDSDGDGIADDTTGDDTTEPGGDIVIDDPTIEPDEPITVRPSNRNTVLTKEQTDSIRAMVEGATQVLRNDDKLNAIISEEAESFFSGQKSIDVVADIIQNRASTYISESR